MRIYEDRGRATLDSWDGICGIRGMPVVDKARMLEELLISARSDLDRATSAVHLLANITLIEPSPVTRVPSIFDEPLLEEDDEDEDNDEL